MSIGRSKSEPYWERTAGWYPHPPPLSLLHELETTLGDRRGAFRPVCVRPPVLWCLGPTGSLSSRLGVGASGSKPFTSEKRSLVLFFVGYSYTDCIPLQNTNSFGQDPCYVVQTLEDTCRGIGECLEWTVAARVTSYDFGTFFRWIPNPAAEQPGLLRDPSTGYSI